MIRYMVLQYRDELLTIQREELTAEARNGETWTRPVHRQSASRRQEWRNLFSDEEKDEVASDLLIILQKIPIQVIGMSDVGDLRNQVDQVVAVNSMPLVIKVRFVASTLLDALTGPSAGGDANAPVSQRTQRAQTYLCVFLPSVIRAEEVLMMRLRGLFADIERD